MRQFDNVYTIMYGIKAQLFFTIEGDMANRIFFYKRFLHLNWLRFSMQQTCYYPSIIFTFTVIILRNLANIKSKHN